MLPGLKLLDALKNHTDFAESGLSTATFVLAMNKPAYERLPRDLKTVIDNNAGQGAAGMAGAMRDTQPGNTMLNGPDLYAASIGRSARYA